MKKRKKSLILTFITGLTLIAVICGVTPASFRAQVNEQKSGYLVTPVVTKDQLTFDSSEKITFRTKDENYGWGTNATASATLQANNTTNEANAYYNVYLIIEENNLMHTTNEGIGELLINIKSPAVDAKGEKIEITNNPVLEYEGHGFDITGLTGIFEVAKNYKISSTGITTHEWEVSVTLATLNNENKGKNFKGYLYLTKEDLNGYILSEINYMDIKTNKNTASTTLIMTEGANEVEKYYFGIEKKNVAVVQQLHNAKTLESKIIYSENKTGSYVFENLEIGQEYIIYSYGVDKNGIKTNIYQAELLIDEDYEEPKIKNVEVTTEEKAITIQVEADGGTNDVYRYYYSLDDGATYQESVSNSYTYANLVSNSSYKIKVRVSDTEDNRSNEYTKTIILGS